MRVEQSKNTRARMAGVCVVVCAALVMIFGSLMWSRIGRDAIVIIALSIILFLYGISLASRKST